MLSTPCVVLLAAAVAMLSLDDAAAHSKMLVPKTEFKDPSSEFSAVGGLDGTQWTYEGINTWDGAARGNAAMKKSNSKTLRQFLMKYSKPNSLATTEECGQTILTGARQPVPDAVNFPAGHNGPCEFWCDNHRIAFYEDCNNEKNKITSVPVGKTKCAKASIIQGMYIGTQAQPWEIYINCAPIAGGTGTDPSKVLDPNAAGDGSSSVAGDVVAPTPSRDNSTTSRPSAPSAPAPAPAPAPSPSVTSTHPAAVADRKNCERRRA